MESRWPDIYVRRLLQRLERLPGPVVQLWGWPGSGRHLVLQKLLELGGRSIPAAWLGDSRRLVGEQRGATKDGVRWLVAATPPTVLPAAADLLMAPPIVVPVARREPIAGTSLVPPEEFLLTLKEAALLWQAELGEAAGDPIAVARWADGWLQPLLRAAAAARRGAALPTSAGALAALPEVARFLRREVVDPLPVALVERLWQLASGDPPRSREPLAREWGLLVEAPGGGLRLPAVLEEWLVRDSATLRPSRKTRPGRGGEREGESGGEAQFQVELFGAPTVLRRTRSGGVREVDWTLKRAFKLLAFLATAPQRRATKAELVEGLWPEDDRATIQRNFHPTLSYLRRSLGAQAGDPCQPLIYRNEVYQLNPEVEWHIDVERFQEEVEMGARSQREGEWEGAVAAWRQAWGRYRGPFLSGFYDPWVVPRREALHRQYLAMLRDLGSALVICDRRDEALDAFRAVLVEDPLEEAVQVEVMRLYAEQGRRDLVRRQYDRLCSLLRAELGVEPLPQTTDDYHRLMA
jgi:DNA-binding SARP family transcriptional activator